MKKKERKVLLRSHDHYYSLFETIFENHIIIPFRNFVENYLDKNFERYEVEEHSSEDLTFKVHMEIRNDKTSDILKKSYSITIHITNLAYDYQLACRLDDYVELSLIGSSLNKSPIKPIIDDIETIYCSWGLPSETSLYVYVRVTPS